MRGAATHAWSKTVSSPGASSIGLILSSARRMRFDPRVAADLTDAQLVARCRGGDHAAWNELVERFSRYVYAITVQAFRLPQHDAEDVFQEVFARVYTHLERLRSDEAIRPWIAQLTRRVCIDRLRAGRREQPEEEIAEEGALDDAPRGRAHCGAVACPPASTRVLGAGRAGASTRPARP